MAKKFSIFFLVLALLAGSFQRGFAGAGLSLSTPTPSQSGNPGQEVTYTVTIKDDSGVSDTYAISFGGTDFWDTESSVPMITVPAYGEETFTVTVEVPSSAMPGDLDALTVTTTSQTDSFVNATLDLTTTANTSHGVDLTPPTQSKSGNPSAQVDYLVSIENTGNVEETFNIALGTHSWVTSAPSTVKVNAYTKSSFTVSVTVAGDAANGDQDAVIVTASSGTVSSHTTLTTTANQVYGVSIIADSTAKAGDPASTASYDLTVTNTGNGTDSYTVSTNSPAWATLVDKISGFSLNKGGSTHVKVDVSVPADALGGAQDTAQITITSSGDPTKHQRVDLVTTANTVYGVQITTGDQNKPGDAGSAVIYTVTIKNTGNVRETYDIALTGSTWASSQVTVGPVDVGHTKNFEVTVNIPAGEAGATQDIATLTVTSQKNSSTSDSCTLTTTVNTRYGVSLTPQTDTKTDYPGVEVTYTLKVKNNSNVPDSYVLSKSGEAWTTTLPSSPIGPLAAGHETTIEVKVTIPGNLVAEGQDVVKVKVTSQMDGTVSSTATLTTHARFRTIYLPMLQKADPNLLYSDDFSNGDRGWAPFRSGGSSGVFGSEYSLSHTAANQFMAAVAPLSSSLISSKGFSIEMDAKLISGSDARVGFVFDWADSSNFYLLQIKPSTQEYMIYRSSGSYTTLKKGSSSLIKTGSGVNSIKVVRTSDKIELYLKDGSGAYQLVTSLANLRTTTGQVGVQFSVYSSVPAQAQYDNFIVKNLP